MKKNLESTFIEAIESGSAEDVKKALEAGADIAIASKEQANGRRPPIEFPSFVNSYDVLFVLWQHGAKATTEHIENIFKKFEKGSTPEVLFEMDRLEKERKLSKVKLDLSNDFSASKLEVKKFDFDLNDANWSLKMVLKPFKFEGRIINQTIDFTSNQALLIQPNSTIVFENQDFNASFYFDDVHNPVDLKSIKFGELKDNKIAFEIDLFFDFEFEGGFLKNQNATFKGKLAIPNN